MGMVRWFSASLALFFSMHFSIRAQDLSSNLDFFSPSEVLRPGSVLYLKFSNDFSLDFQSTSTFKTSPNPQVSEIVSQYFSFFPKISENLSREREMKISFTDKTKGILAAIVVAYDEKTRVYQLLAKRKISHNQQKGSHLVLNAFVDAESVDENRFVDADRLANLSLVYRDQSQNIQLTPKDFAHLLPKKEREGEDFLGEKTEKSQENGQNFSPNAEKNKQNHRENNEFLVSELTEKKKKELFLKYFNWLLNSLF